MKRLMLLCALALACWAGDKAWIQGKLVEASTGGKTNYKVVKARKIFSYVIEAGENQYQAEDKATEKLPVEVGRQLEFAVDGDKLWVKVEGKEHKLELIRTMKKE